MCISKYNSEGYPDPTVYEALMNIERENRRKYGYRPLVYVCSPFSGDPEGNAEKARRYCRFAVGQGYIPVAPHLLFSQFMSDRAQEERQLALFMDSVLLTKCTELWVFGDDITEGMSLEIAHAKRKGQTIRRFTDQCGEVRE